MLATNQEVQDKAIAAIRETYTVDQPLGDANDQQTCQYLVILIKEILRYSICLQALARVDRVA
jgi:3-hydroxyphenylacetate 6-hydroxylase